MGRFLPFFPLTSSFFGLTSNYKIPLLDEVLYVTQKLKGFNYSDVMAMPTWERRHWVSTVNRAHEEVKSPNTSNVSKGRRTTKIGGEQLKSQMMAGKIPFN